MIKPIQKFIALKKIIEEVKTTSGLVLTAKDASEMRYQKGEIIAVGDEVPNIKSGDIVLYDTSNSYTMLINEEPVTIIQYREVVGVY